MEEMSFAVNIHRAKTINKPTVRRRRRRANRALKIVWSGVWYCFLTLVGLILYKVGAAYALRQRGHYAVGGEVLLLLLPVLWGLCYTVIRDWVRDAKKH
jgi:hypothetical protein